MAPFLRIRLMLAGSEIAVDSRGRAAGLGTGREIWHERVWEKDQFT